MESTDAGDQTQHNSGRITRILEWCRTPRWHAVVTWVVLTWGAREIGLPNLNLVLDPLDDLIHGLSAWLPGGSASELSLARQAAAVALLFCWFEPFLLRLNITRGAAWLGIKAWVTVVFLLVPYPNMPTTNVMGRWQLENFVCAASPALALIGWRTRPWMTIPAAIVHCLAIFAFHFVPWPYGTLVAAALYGATLLYGTRQLRT
jgi:hypothetical protein